MRISDWSSDVCSSDLFGQLGRLGGLVLVLAVEQALDRAAAGECEHAQQHPGRAHGAAAGPGHRMVHQSTLLWIGLHRSEEHTSELQSLMSISYAGFCLQKKNATHMISTTHNTEDKANVH